MTKTTSIEVTTVTYLLRRKMETSMDGKKTPLMSKNKTLGHQKCSMLEHLKEAPLQEKGPNVATTQ
jgi:hypothetical protein